VDLGTVVASSWSAGISLYGVLAALGIAGRLEWIEGPWLLEHPVVIAVALALFAVELVVDKIAVLDTVWDAAHTVLRPLGGALIGALAPDQDLPVPVLLVLGALLAMTSHSAKASARVLINTSPEPLSNAVVSAGEDGLVGVVMALAIAYPNVAFGVTVVLVMASVATTVAVVVTGRAVARSVKTRWRRRRDSP
jgi:hypothetical protein